MRLAWGRGHRYLTMVYQIDAQCKRLLWVGEKRTVKTLLTFFHWLGTERSAACASSAGTCGSLTLRSSPRRRGRPSTSWIAFTSWGTSARPSMRSVPRKLGSSRPEAMSPVLTKTRWLLLKRPENLTEKQEIRLADLLRYNLRTVRSYLLKEDFQFFWGYTSPYWAGQFLDQWCTRTMRSKIGPMKNIARMLRGHRTADPQLVPRQRAALERRGRRIQYQGKTDYQKGLRFSDLSCAGSRFVSYTWRSTRAEVYP